LILKTFFNAEKTIFLPEALGFSDGDPPEYITHFQVILIRIQA
jgi:hypothetical protein